MDRLLQGFPLRPVTAHDAFPASQTGPVVAGLVLTSLALVSLLCIYLGWQGRLVLAEAAGLIVIAIVIGIAAARMLLPGRVRADSTTGAVTLDHFGDLVTWHSSTGNVLAASVTSGHGMGLDSAMLHGHGLLNQVHVADRPLFLKTLSDAAHGDRVTSATIRLMASAEKTSPPVAHWLELRARRIGQDPSREGATVIAAMQDVTLRRSDEESREQVLRQAETAASAKGSFLATVSHELRTPLNAIIGFSEMLSNEALRPSNVAQQFEYARIIHSSGHHLLEVVNALLDVSKIESGAMTLDQEPADIAVLIGNCCDLMGIRALSNGIHFERVTGTGLEQVICDRRAIKQIILNLLSNALKFTPAGGNVTIAAVRDGQMIDISVADSGIGISAEDLPRLGQPFFQAKGTYDRAYEGTGLGLSVVRGLVGLHGGTLEVESAPGSGTRVCLRIPADGSSGSIEPVQIATFVKSPPRGLAHLEPYRLTA
jgi:two-component system, cell cycle sensor histidine kinase DivJ